MDFTTLLDTIDAAATKHRFIIEPGAYHTADRVIQGAMVATELAMRARVKELNDTERQRQAHRQQHWSDLMPSDFRAPTPTTNLVLSATRQAHAANRFGGVTPADQPPEPAPAPARRFEIGDLVFLTGDWHQMRHDAVPNEIIDDYRAGVYIQGEIVNLGADNHRVELEDLRGTWWFNHDNLEHA